ncbi:MAG TPA: transposase [Mycobacterium sp.]
MEDTVVLSVVVAAALSGRIRMVSPMARVSCWLTNRAETPSDPPGLVVDERKRIDAFEKRWRDSYPAAVRCLLADRDSLTVYLRCPREHWTRVRHSNFIERTFGETRRRVKVIGRLPGEHSCLKLVWAVLDRASTGWRGFTMTPAGLRLLHDLRRSLHDPPTRLPQRNSEVHTETGVAPTDSAAIA